MFPTNTYGNDTGRSKKLLIGVIVLVLVIVLSVVFSIVSSRDNKTGVSGILTRDNGLRNFSNSSISINYPQSLTKSFSGSKLTLSSVSNREGASDQLIILPYLSKSDGTSLNSLVNLNTKNGRGEVIAKTEQRTVNKRAALILTPTDSNAKIKKSLYVEGDSKIWLVDATFLDERSDLAKNINSVFNSFTLKADS